MLFRIKTSFALTVVLMLFSCALRPPLADGQASSTDKTVAEKAEADKAAAVKEFEKNPLLVTGIEPFVASEEKGEIGNPNKLGQAGMGDRISVHIPRLSQAAKYKVIDPAKLVLFVDGQVFNDVYPESVGSDSVVYKLERTPAAIDSWNGLLGRPRLDSRKPVVVSVGYADQLPLNLSEAYHGKANLNLIVYRRKWAVVCLIGLIAMLLLFVRYGRKDLLRDSGPPSPPPGKLKPYSLAKVQVAWWFFLVVGCFLLIYLITGEFTMTEQALILIGIGTGTALGSAMIDASKLGSADSELETLQPERGKLEAETKLLGNEVGTLEKAIAANPGATDTEKASLLTDQESLKAKTVELAEKNEKLNTVSAKIEKARAGLTRPASQGLWNDLVTDANGPSFHRFQMIVWTVILGILFLGGVYKNLAMPEFSGTMLALMGISAGTYLGFKIPERNSKAGPDEEKTANEAKGEEKVS